MSLLRSLLLLLALAACSGCGRLDQPAAHTAFIQRIQPADFASAELPFDEPLSSTYELVFLRTDYGRPVSALALKPEAEGGYTLYFGSADADGKWLHVTTSLNDDVGRQVLRATELKLHRNIVITPQRRNVAKNDGDLWIFQRLSDGRIAAGLTPYSATVGNDRAAVFIQDLLGGLQQLAAADTDRRQTLLAAIDQVATGIILEDTPQ